jgi:methyl-accepting chemotaxis protein
MHGSVSIIDRAANVTTQALEEAERFRAALQDNILELQEANVTSTNALSMVVHVENLSEELLQNISNFMETVNSSIEIVLSLNRTGLPNINILHQLTNQTLSIAISKTYHEIRDVLTDINTTIDSFPSIEFDGTLRMRAEKALNDSLLANVTATIVMRNIMELRELLVDLKSQGTLLEKRTNDNQRDLTNIQRIINEVKVRVNLVQTTLHRLSVKISNFNTTIREIRNLFDTNVQELEQHKKPVRVAYNENWETP